jgi:UDP-N-acetylmuramyl pentapeptide phosphotransferase/UDP-N-acetylglucosamine-1-phosphate transferase
LLWAALVVYLLLGGVGFLDDSIKLRRRHNHGLSARAKLAGQFAAGLLLGLFLVLSPITTNPTYLKARDIVDPKSMIIGLADSADQDHGLGGIWKGFSEETRIALADIAARPNGVVPDRNVLLDGLNRALESPALASAFPEVVAGFSAEAAAMYKVGPSALEPSELVRLNRLLLESAIPEYIAKRPDNVHTKVGIPGFKDLFVPMGPFYVLFVILIIISVSNSVNLTDGLDGLAAGASVVSIMAFAAIAYIVSRADWTEYLYLIHVPEASELFVFGAALLGTGLGFLWFNGHPAEVFMGDTGSLSLGGAIAAMAILTKQELLLPIVGGLFVLEGGSVVLQVASYKLTGKRVFRMAPLHHHFELLGWTETKVTLRFWIVAVLFAMLSLATLKLR